MLNKLSYNLANSLNESESDVLKVSKKVLIESDGVKTKKLDETLKSVQISFECPECGYSWNEDFNDYFEDEDDLINVFDSSEAECPECGADCYGESYEIIEETEEGSLVETSYEYMSNKSGIPVEDLSKVVPKLIKKDKNFRDYATDYQIRIIKKELEKLKSEESIEEAEELKEEYSEKLGGDPADFISDVESIKTALEAIDVSNFGTHLAQQMIEDWIETCNTQIEKGKRLASGDEFYSESSLNEDINSNVLTKEQLWKLRKEIVLGSIYTNDYENSFGINPENVQAFFDSFIENAQQDDEGNFNNRKVEEFDNPDELYDYYAGCEFPFGEMNESEGCSKQKIEETEINEVERVHETIENAETEAEVKEAILSISDNRLESEVLSAFNQCIQDGDDLDALKGHVLATLEDNAIYNESEELTEEVEVKNLQVIKEQGNVYMLEDENKKMIVGENYNADEGIIENAEIYENKEEADKDYLSRCDIIKDGEEFKSEEPAEEVMDEGIIDDLKLNHRVKKADKASERYDADKSKRNKKKMNKAFNKLDAEKERQIKKHQDKINKIKKA